MSKDLKHKQYTGLSDPFILAHRKHNYVYTTESFSRHYYCFTSIAVRCDVRSCALLTCSTCTNFNFFLWKYLISNVNLFFYIYVICELKSFFFQIMISGDKYIGCIIGEVVNFYLGINRELFFFKEVVAVSMLICPKGVADKIILWKNQLQNSMKFFFACIVI